MAAKKKTTKKAATKKKPSISEKHSEKLDYVRDELRIIGMEYADIKARIETTDLLVDHVIAQLDMERRMRRINVFLTAIVLLLVSLLLASFTLIVG